MATLVATQLEPSGLGAWRRGPTAQQAAAERARQPARAPDADTQTPGLPGPGYEYTPHIGPGHDGPSIGI